MQTIQDGQKNLNSQKQGFFSSGIFFILLGLAFLVAAYFSLERGVHTSFSFVLVVLGIAILLFGTGTQGIGRLESNTQAARYSIAVAGGAGALAVAIGVGMSMMGPRIQQAFELQTRYVSAELRPASDGNSSFAGWWGHFELDGRPIASFRQGEFFFAYVPYSQTQLDREMHITYTLLPEDPTHPNPNLKPRVIDFFNFRPKDVDLNNSGSDFPIYDNIPPVDLRSAGAVNAVLKVGGSQSLGNAPGAQAPNPAPPVVLEGQ